jgi:hypothetical protein
MKRALLVLAALAGGVGPGASASAATPPRGAAISDSLEYIGRVPDSSDIVEGKFDTVMGRDVLVTTGTYGFRTYDVRDASKPKALDTFQPAQILGKNGHWQDEDMEIDRKRKLIIGALDPRHDDIDQTSCPGLGHLSAKNRNPKCRSGFYVISYRNPRHLEQVGDFVEVPAGHTTSCIDSCRYVWTGGPARRNDQVFPGDPFIPGARGDGRPIWVTDLSNPWRPRTFENPIDLKRNDGATDYSHDVNAPITECSAHYFEVSGSTLAAAWYNQGLRVIDASNARNLRQVGYYYVKGTDEVANPSSLSWDTAWRGNLVYLFDMDRGIEILRLRGGPHASAKLATVREPRRGVDRLAKVPVSGLTAGSLVCPLFARQ